MGELATNIKTNQIENLVLSVTGKIVGKSSYEGRTRYLVVCPANDEYDYPATLEIGSDDSSRQKGDEIKNVKCKLGGKKNSFTTRNGDNVITANMWLNELD